MKIHATREYKYMISDFYTKNIDEINKAIPAIPSHPNILIPHTATIENKCLYLHYTVCLTGMTLRDFIGQVNSSRINVRTTVYNALHRVKPVAMIMELIQIYEFMISKNMLIGQSNINPDNIWVEREQNGHLKLFVLYTMETHVECHFRTNTCRKYLPSEIVKEHHSLLDNELSKPKFTRFDTRATPISIVYSLGLILYFIAAGQDAFDRYRFDPFEKPFIGNGMNALVSKLIMSATEPDYTHRPSLTEWKQQMADRKKFTCIMM
jgi:hypothetical protein